MVRSTPAANINSLECPKLKGTSMAALLRLKKKKKKSELWKAYKNLNDIKVGCPLHDRRPQVSMRVLGGKRKTSVPFEHARTYIQTDTRTQTN